MPKTAAPRMVREATPSAQNPSKGLSFVILIILMAKLLTVPAQTDKLLSLVANRRTACQS